MSEPLPISWCLQHLFLLVPQGEVKNMLERQRLVGFCDTTPHAGFRTGQVNCISGMSRQRACLSWAFRRGAPQWPGSVTSSDHRVGPEQS